MFNAQLASANLGVLGNDDMSANDLETLKIYYPSLAYVFDHIANLQEMIEEAEDAAAGELKETTDEAERKLGWIEEHANELKGYIDQANTDLDDDYDPIEPDLERMGELVALIITETEEFKP